MAFVQMLLALLAEVLIGRALRAEDTNAGTMLPNLTDVTLDKKARNIFSEFYRNEHFAVGSICWRASRILVGAADAPDSLVFFLNVLTAVCHFYRVKPRGFVVVILSAFAPPTEEGIVEILERLRRERGARCGFARRDFVDGPCIAIGATGRDRGAGRLLRLRRCSAGSRGTTGRWWCHWGVGRIGGRKGERRRKTEGGRE